MTNETLNHDSLMDLPLNDFDLLYCHNIGKSEIEDICKTCLYNIGFCPDCVDGVKAYGIDDKGNTIICACYNYEKLTKENYNAYINYREVLHE